MAIRAAGAGEREAQAEAEEGQVAKEEKEVDEEESRWLSPLDLSVAGAVAILRCPDGCFVA